MCCCAVVCCIFFLIFYFFSTWIICIEVFGSTDDETFQVMAKEMIETVKNYRECRKEKTSNTKANAIIIYIPLHCSFFIVACFVSSA